MNHPPKPTLPTSNSICIRFATVEDSKLILHFVQHLARYEKLEHEVVLTEEKIRSTLFCEKPSAEVLFLEENKIPVGFAIFFHNYSTFLGKPGLYLEDLFVLPELRGKGYGKRLLAYLAKTALHRNCGRFEWAVLDWNQPAIDFYLSVGAKPVSEWTVFRLTNAELERFAQTSLD